MVVAFGPTGAGMPQLHRGQGAWPFRLTNRRPPAGPSQPADPQDGQAARVDPLAGGPLAAGQQPGRFRHGQELVQNLSPAYGLFARGPVARRH